MSKKKDSKILQFPDATKTAVSIMSLVNEIDALKNETQKVSEMAARAILKSLDLKDHYTFGHSMRVCYFALVLGRELKLDHDELYQLELSALFHDIGKIGTPDAVLNKPSRLNEDEFSVMKQHPTNSYKVLKEFEQFQTIALNARHHHERYDGRGYPDQLKADEIPLGARIILICDTFDAMTSTRPYRKGLPYDTAFEELLEFSGSQFDPLLVKKFIRGMQKEAKKGESTFYISLMDQQFKKDAA